MTDADNAARAADDDDDDDDNDGASASKMKASKRHSSHGAGQPSPTAPGRGHPLKTSADTDGCTSDFDCSFGAQCLHTSGRAHGYCGRAVDSSGMRSRAFGGEVSGCFSSMDCPSGFKCVGTGTNKVCAR